MRRIDLERQKLGNALLARDRGKCKLKLSGHYTGYKKKARQNPRYARLARSTKGLMELF